MSDYLKKLQETTALRIYARSPKSVQQQKQPQTQTQTQDKTK